MEKEQFWIEKLENERTKQYQSIFEESSNYPEELNSIKLRLEKKIYKKRRKTYITRVVSVAAIFAIFVLLVNTPTAMAETIPHMPLIGTFAEYVCFDKGLQNAVKNKYTQEVNLVEKNNGYTLEVPSVIADSKRLVVFFQIPENAVKQQTNYIHVYINKIVNTATGKEYKEYSSESNGYLVSEENANGNLCYTSIRSVGTSMPQDLKVYVTMSSESFLQGEATKESRLSDIFEPTSNTKMQQLGDYVFELHLDNYPNPKTITLNKEIKVNGQTIQINSVTEYPTGTEVSVYIPNDNECIINGLDFQAIDNNGNEWGNTGGVISIGSDGDDEILYYLEGNYFSTASLDKILVKGIRLIKKSEGNITIDLQEKTMTPKLPYLNIKSIERAEEKAYITFESDDSECFGLFRHEYQDTAGKKYEFNSESCEQRNGKVENNIAIVWPENNKVILTRSMSPMIKLEKPVEIMLDNCKK